MCLSATATASKKLPLVSAGRAVFELVGGFVFEVDGGGAVGIDLRVRDEGVPGLR